MRLIEAKCPNCHANVEIDLDNLKASCPYCGSQLFLEFDVDRYLENKEETIRENNRLKEATVQKEKELESLERTKRADLERQKQAAKLRKTELKFKDRKDRREKSDPDNRLFAGIMICCFIMIFVGAGFGFVGNFIRGFAPHEENEVQLPISAEEILEEKYDYNEAKELFESVGFTNVTVEKDEDLKLGILKEEGRVKSVTVNGEKKFEKGAWKAKDARIVITYHAKKGKKSKK